MYPTLHCTVMGRAMNRTAARVPVSLPISSSVVGDYLLHNGWYCTTVVCGRRPTDDICSENFCQDFPTQNRRGLSHSTWWICYRMWQLRQGTVAPAHGLAKSTTERAFA